MLIAGLVIEWPKSRLLLARGWDILFGLLVVFIIVPGILWMPAKLLLTDQQLLFGFVFSSLCPVAMVAPYFSQIHRADSELSMTLVIVSMLICPLIIPIGLNMLVPISTSIDLTPLIRYMFFLVVIPLLLSAAVSNYLPRVRMWLSRYEGFFGSTALSFLIFSLFGTITSKVNMSYLDIWDFASIFFLAFLQDFGFLMIARCALKRRLNGTVFRAIIISASMKNIAIAAGILLIYDPRAAVAPALAFIAHAALFTFLSNPKISRWTLRWCDH